MYKESKQLEGKAAFVVFGVTGDLTRRKLIPALYELQLAGRLPEDFHIIGFARRDWTDEFLREDPARRRRGICSKQTSQSRSAGSIDQ